MQEEYVIQINLYITNVLSHEISNEDVILLYYKIGSYLVEKQLQSRELKILERELQTIYGIVIGFTVRNFISMIHFYQMYSNQNLEMLKHISWNEHLKILKEKDMKKRKQMLLSCTSSNNEKNYMLTELRILRQKILCNS